MATCSTCNGNRRVKVGGYGWLVQKWDACRTCNGTGKA